MKKVISFEDKKKLFHELASLISDTAGRAIGTWDRFSMALSGGRTPRNLYATLSREFVDRIDWGRTFLFWGDERFVPPDHPESNYRMVKESLLSHIPIPPGNVFPVPTGMRTVESSAIVYEKTVKEFFKGEDFPRFDLILLGLGEDGHVASLFKGDAAMEEAKRWVTAATAPKQYAVRQRITLTFPAINNARTIVLLVTGEKKRAILERVLKNEGGYPAVWIKPAGSLNIFTDLEGF